MDGQQELERGDPQEELVISYKAHLTELEKVREEEKRIYEERLSLMRRDIEAKQIQRARNEEQASVSNTRVLPSEALIDSLFANRPVEKRQEWKHKLEAAELTTMPLLASLDDAQWLRLGLPLGVEAQLREAIAKSQAEDAVKTSSLALPRPSLAPLPPPRPVGACKVESPPPLAPPSTAGGKDTSTAPARDLDISSTVSVKKGLGAAFGEFKTQLSQARSSLAKKNTS